MDQYAPHHRSGSTEACDGALKEREFAAAQIRRRLVRNAREHAGEEDKESTAHAGDGVTHHDPLPAKIEPHDGTGACVLQQLAGEVEEDESLPAEAVAECTG